MSFFRPLLGGRASASATASRPDRHPVRVRGAAREAAEAALDGPLVRAYGGLPSQILGVSIHFEDGGPDPLDSVAVFEHARGHLHYVGRGLFRFGVPQELTLRLGRTAATDGPSPVALLNMLARRVLRSQRVFRHGDVWQGPPGVRPGHLAFAHDPELGTVDTPDGPVTYVQAVVIDAVQHTAILADPGHAELERLIASDPLLVSPAL
ncbi:MAG: suppressor of fused domain protein [Deltaproteobacteria bacterium]|nr:suppressor of fused domain protein [Deltaproteobacteria bacterium]